MLSRVANSIYWMNRMIERAENTARFVTVNFYLSLDMPDWMGAQWEPLVLTTGDQEYFEENYGEANEANVLNFLLFDENYSNSVLSCLLLAKENARSIQENMTSEVVEHINGIVDRLQTFPKLHLHMDDLEDLLAEIKSFSHVVAGCSEATFNRDEGWYFRNLGVYLERADKTSRILDVKYFYLYPSVEDVNTPLDNIPWFSLLNSTGGLEMYARRHGIIQHERVVEFLLLDPEFARAVSFCIGKALQSLRAITKNPPHLPTTASERELGSLYADMCFIETEHLLNRGLHEFLDELQTRLNQVGAAVQSDFFDHDIE